jgi:hypothetical protein
MLAVAVAGRRAALERQELAALEAAATEEDRMATAQTQAPQTEDRVGAGDQAVLGETAGMEVLEL